MDKRIRQMIEVWDVAAEKPTAEDLCADCPELLAELKEVLGALAAADSLLDDQYEPPRLEPSTLVSPAILIPGYKILRRVGQGGQAVVYAAIKENTGRKVAVKVLLHGSLASPQVRGRFDREVAILAKLDHPNIVTVIDRGTTSDGSLFVAMDFVEGQPLDKYIAAPLSPSGDSTAQTPAAPDRGRMLALFSKICDAIQAAHDQGVIHRDLKPNNLLVDDRGEPHILDFGVARSHMAGADYRRLSITDQFLGTLAWASPEQADARELDQRTDVYSLGLILYYMLTGGRFPYNVLGPMAQVLNNILQAQPIPPSKILAPSPARRGRDGRRNYLPPEPPLNPIIEAIVLKALSKKPQDRYSSAREMAEVIRNYLCGLAVSAKADAPRSGTAPWIPLGIGCLIAVVVGAVVQRRFHRDVTPTPAKISVVAAPIVSPTTSASLISDPPKEPGLWRRIDVPAIENCDMHFLPDSRRLMVVADNRSMIWDVQTGQSRPYAGWGAVSEDGRWVWAGRPVSVETGAPATDDEIFRRGFSPILFQLSDRVMLRFDTARRRGLHFPTGHISRISADGRYALGINGDNKVHLVDAETEKSLATFGHRMGVGRLPEISPNGDLVLIPSLEGDVFSLWLWDWKHDTSTLLIDPADSKTASFEKFSPDGTRILVEDLAGADAALTLWDLSDASAPKRIWGHGLEHRGAFVFSPDNRAILSANHNGARDLSMLDRETGNEIYRLHDDRSEQTPAIALITFSPDERLAASAAPGGAVFIWRLSESAPLTPATQKAPSVLPSASGEWRATTNASH
ncbi:MAG TPA: WD40 repeat domain-containing serine/threonine protein kinase [Tepidisphaeraceae bacterium]|jgi:serine/threonine protein kinase|nr:WD40 repeat domain-containing serine/threonine protein kinase [Tepidisphaeraceae bacterium]